MVCLKWFDRMANCAGPHQTASLGSRSCLNSGLIVYSSSLYASGTLCEHEKPRSIRVFRFFQWFVVVVEVVGI